MCLLRAFNSTSCQDVLHRHPLYLIVRMLCYDDGLGTGRNLLALKTTDGKQEECSIWVYQCSSSVSVRGNFSLDLDLKNIYRLPQVARPANESYFLFSA